MTFLRAALFNAGLFFWTLILGIIGLPVLLLPRRAIVAFSGFWTAGVLTWLRLSVGLDHEVIGRENLPPGGVIVAMKHQSAWDTLILNRVFADPAIVLKRELVYIPIFGWFLAANGMIAVDRSAGAKALKELLTKSRNATQAGRPVVIFPEGTRAPVGETLPFHPGVAALYRDLSLPLVPVALNSGLFWGRRRFLKRAGRIRLEILPPIAPGLPRKVAMATLEQAIDTASRRLAGLAPRSISGPPVPMTLTDGQEQSKNERGAFA